jgi:hypothetical protein
VKKTKRRKPVVAWAVVCDVATWHVPRFSAQKSEAILLSTTNSGEMVWYCCGKRKHRIAKLAEVRL